MDLSVSEEQSILRESVRRFLAGEYDAAQREKFVKPGARCESKIWRDFAELGWLSLPFSAADGGLGGGSLETAILMEEFGAALVVEPYLSSVLLGGALVSRLGSAEQRLLLNPLMAGARKLAFAYAEPGSHDRLHHVSTTARRSPEGWVLQGAKSAVLDGGQTDYYIVSARVAGLVDDKDGIALFVVPAETPDLKIAGYRSVDGRAFADVTFCETALPPDALLGGCVDAVAAIESVVDHATVALCADAVGAISVLVDATVQYAKDRKQFGKPIGSFQALQHRMADMAVQRAEAQAVLLLGVLKLDGDPIERARAVSAAKAKIGSCARFIGQQAVQIHGAMGVTEELNIGAYFKRLTTFELLFGSTRFHLSRYAALAVSSEIMEQNLVSAPGRNPSESSSAALKLSLTAEEHAFQDQVRSFFELNFPKELARAQRLTTTVFAEYDISHAWQKKLHAQGWVAPGWPREFGGTGWTMTERYIFNTESARANAPFTSPIALHMVGPVLIHFGTAEQQNKFLPAILSGADYWCQGFSEPNAGSDLASLNLRAVKVGDEYVLNGSKIWTTHAHYANWMIALVRTSDLSRPQAGISCLLLRMDSPGLLVRPIRTIGGDHEVNQVFFDDVRVPAGNLVAGEGEGWAVAKFLLEFERGGDMAAAGIRQSFATLVQRARIAAAETAFSHLDFCFELARLGADIDALEMLELRTLATLQAGQNAGPAASIMKLRASQLQQDVSELELRMVGDAALRWQSERPLYNVSISQAEDELLPVLPRYLNSRANTIFGGSSEIQKTIIARSMLGL